MNEWVELEGLKEDLALASETAAVIGIVGKRLRRLPLNLQIIIYTWIMYMYS